MGAYQTTSEDFTPSNEPKDESFSLTVEFPLAIEIVPAEEDWLLVSSASYDADHWSTASIIRRLGEHFEALLAAAAR